MKALVADDEQIIRFGLKLVLKSLWPDIIVSEAQTLDGVADLISTNDFNLAILDINMPGSSGLENLIEFSLQNTTVIIFSGYEKTSSRIESLKQAGVDEFIFKDASVAEIKVALVSHF
ncbi:response regulator [Pedobacter xixiisoli]|nr:response regulator transcription factor [Pedobacter xixiisoli]